MSEGGTKSYFYDFENKGFFPKNGSALATDIADALEVDDGNTFSEFTVLGLAYGENHFPLNSFSLVDKNLKVSLPPSDVTEFATKGAKIFNDSLLTDESHDPFMLSDEEYESDPLEIDGPYDDRILDEDLEPGEEKKDI